MNNPLDIWYAENKENIEAFEAQMRKKVHYVIEPQHLWSNIAEMARIQDNELLLTLMEGFRYIENESFGNRFTCQPILFNRYSSVYFGTKEM